MKRILIFTLLAFSIHFYLHPAGKDTIKVIDHFDRVVEISKNPKRVIALQPIAVQIIYCLDYQDNLIACDNMTKVREWAKKIDPGLGKKDALTFGGDNPPNIEAIAALHPDLVIYGAFWPQHIEAISKVATVIAFDFHLRSTVEAVDLIGKSIGKEKEAKELIKYIEEKTKYVTDITDKIPLKEKPKTLYETYQSTSGGFSLSTCGNKAFQHGLIQKAGGINLGEKFNVIWQIVDPEQLLAWDPDVMFMRPPDVSGQKSVTIKELEADPVLNKLSLVKNKKYFIMPYGEFSSSVNAPEGVIGLLFMAKKLHPDKFKNLDLEKEVKYFYQRWFRYKLTDKEVYEILNPQ